MSVDMLNALREKAKHSEPDLEAAVTGLPEYRGSIIEQRRAASSQETLDIDNCGPHIRCPKCRYRPRKTDRWSCECLHMWNTFDTGGVCPSCMRQWKETQCLQCFAWSAHSDWYATE